MRRANSSNLGSERSPTEGGIDIHADAGSDVPTLYAENDDAIVEDEVFRAYMAAVDTSVIIGNPGCSGNGLYFVGL